MRIIIPNSPSCGENEIGIMVGGGGVGEYNTKVVRIVLFHSLSETSITRELFQKGDLNQKK